MTRLASDSIFMDDSEKLPFLWRAIPVGLLLLMIFGPMVWSIGPLFFHGFYGPDDYLRMVQVAGFLEAPFSSPYQFDRMGPEGISNFTWTRIADLVPAFCIWLLRPVLGEVNAAYAAATITPALYLSVLFSLVYIYARQILTRKQAVMALILVTLTWPMMRQFMPGRVDHHALTLLFFLAGFIFSTASLKSSRSITYPVCAGLCFALSLAVAIEVLPWVALVSALGGMYWVLKGSEALRANVIYALSLLGFGCLTFMSFRFPWAGLAAACDTLSPQILIMLSGVPIVWIFILSIQNFCLSSVRRFIALCVGGASVSYMLFNFTGHCLVDPYNIQDQLIHDIWLKDVQEAHPWYKLWGEYSQIAAQSALPFVLGIAGSLWAWRLDKSHRYIWAGITCLLIGGFILMNIQTRFGEFAALLSPVPIIWGGCKAFSSIRDYLSKRFEFTPAKRIGLSATFFMICLLFFLSRFQAEHISTDVTAENEPKCSSQIIAHVLSQQPEGGVAAHVNIGPELLFRTAHRVLSAPYHMNEKGMRAVYDIYAASDNDTAMDFIKTYNVSYLAICPAELSYWQEVSDQEDIFARRLLNDTLPKNMSELPAVQGQVARIYRVDR